jgi:hypothetical protein
MKNEVFKKRYFCRKSHKNFNMHTLASKFLLSLLLKTLESMQKLKKLSYVQHVHCSSEKYNSICFYICIKFIRHIVFSFVWSVCNV